MNMQLILLLLLCSGLIGVSDGTDSKRLLLNEPTIFQDRLNRVENMLAILQNTVKQQAMTMQQQADEIKGTSNKLNQSSELFE
jgi:hypothetical protein